MNNIAAGAGLIFLCSLIPLAAAEAPTSAAAGHDAVPAALAEDCCVPGELIVRFLPGAAAAGTAQHQALGAVAVETVAADGSPGLQRVRLPAGLDMAQALAAYRANPYVAFAEPNYRVRLAGLPDDPEFDRQWGLQNTGEPFGPGGESGTAGADIAATEAWNTTTGDASVVVAVLDTGVDYQHEDLHQNMWVNPEPGTEADCDPDGDDWFEHEHGVNFIACAAPTDGNGHGTHVSGIIGAVGNNGTGIAGINWDVSVMALKFLDDAGNGNVFDAVKAIDFAIENGVDVINASYAYGPNPHPAEQEAIRRAADAGIVFVAAAGNEGMNNDPLHYGDHSERASQRYPASHRVANVIAAAASDADDQLAGFSNFGPNTVHLGAPGVTIYGTQPADDYAFLSGTSMAAAMVSGVTGLVLAWRPVSPVTAREVVLNSVDERPAFAERTLSAGRANADQALGLDPEQMAPFRPTFLEADGAGGAGVELTWLENSVVAECYRVERRRLGETAWTVLADCIAPGTQAYTDATADVDSAGYAYRVLASNGHGQSRYSNVAEIGLQVEAPNPAHFPDIEAATERDSRCFLATAAYGTPHAPELELLRAFRDEVLLPHPLGRQAVDVYYRYGPELAKPVAHSTTLQTAIRLLLRPVVAALAWWQTAGGEE